MLVDRQGRVMRTLRLSVTDRCQLRCRYCMPASGRKFMPKRRMLSREAFGRCAALLVELGIRRIKLTGGEPLLYPDLCALVRDLAALPGLEDLSLTTNGQNLAALAAPLKSAGLRRVTVSLDTLKPNVYRALTRGAEIDAVQDGILAADAAGLAPLKVNTVLLREWNAEEAGDLAALTLERPWELRFIEHMPLDRAPGLSRGAGADEAWVRSRLEARFGALEPLPAPASSPARRFRIKGARGSLGFISAMSARFCAACDRLRLSADGYLRLCMAHPDGLDLAAALSSGAPARMLRDLVAEAVRDKPEGHAWDGPETQASIAMSSLGG